MLNEWRKFVNEAEQISEEQKDPEMIAQARLDGATDYREGGSMERADKWEGGPYFEEYKDAYYTEREEGDRQDYYRDLDDDLNEEEGAASSFDKRKEQIVRIHDGFVDFLEAEGKFPMGEIPKSVMDALMNAAMITVDAMKNDLGDQKRSPEDEEAERKQIERDRAMAQAYYQSGMYSGD